MGGSIGFCHFDKDLKLVVCIVVISNILKKFKKR